MNDHPPPVTKYKLTLTIRANTHEEIAAELHAQAHGGFLLSSDYYTRDELDSTGGRDRLILEHTNPEMTPERYAEQLTEWFDANTAAKR